jgi:8-oxo-dGTP diphosphatase
MRRFGEPVDLRRTYRDRLGAYAVIRDGGDVLVTEQAEPQREFQLPGGGIDPGEGMLRALHRECMEETGWRIRVLRRLGAFQRYVYMPEYDLWARKVCCVYLARPVLRLGPPSEAGHRAVWMPIRTAIDLVENDGDRAFLQGIAKA